MSKSPFKVGRKTSAGSGLFLSVGEGETVKVVPLTGLDSMVNGDVHEHWDIKPAVIYPCIGADCPGCQIGHDSRWKGYLPVAVREGDDLVSKIWTLTISVYNQLEAAEDMTPDISLEGQLVGVARKGSGKKTRYNVALGGSKVDVSEVEIPDFIRFLGPQTREGILKLMEERMPEAVRRLKPLSEPASTTGPEDTVSDDDDKWDW